VQFPRTKPLTEADRTMLRRAADEGDMCGRCGKPFEPNEPVFRQGYREDVLHYSRWGGAAPVCAGCVRFLEDFVYVAPCVGCGRTVHNERPKQHTVCSYRCRKNFEALQRKRRRHAKRQPVVCVACGFLFTPRRVGATTCDNTCRQRLFRRRRRERVTENSLAQIATSEQPLRCEVAEGPGRLGLVIS
jgi:predicted nucleic acid-binding Zn ribbon protein